MRFSKRQLYFLFIVVTIVTLLTTLKMPYYIYKPGRADALDEIVAIESGYESAGELYLVTVTGGQATPIQLAWSKLSPYHDVVPLKQARPDGITDDEYLESQLRLMESSQQAAVIVAYEAAGAHITIDYEGVYVVSIVEDMPAEGYLETGDLILSVDQHEVKSADDMIDYLATKSAGDLVNLEVVRGHTKTTKQLALKSFKNEPNKVGIGVQLVTDRKVSVDPEVNFSSGKIGGPSAGLMFALKLYDLLTETDLTKGYQIAGTGEIDYDGNVHSVGGVDKKVIAANRAGCDIFFVPFQKGKENSNYDIAKKTAKKINASMEIIPIDTFNEALFYLEGLPEKAH